jgi:ribosomal protein L11 methyltransferase
VRDGVNDPGPTWATVRIRFDPRFEPRGPERTLERLADHADRLDELGALLALDPSVGGVETRDPTTYGHPERPELWVYTVPEAVEAIARRAAAIGGEMGLRLRLETSCRSDEDWRDAWKEFYRPIIVGKRSLLVRPSWIERRDGDPACELLLDPGRAFGTGLHATTRLCLERICALHETGARFSSILDLGCGSGILALAAARLHPQTDRVVAVDIDPEATATTAENAAQNALADRITVVTGGIEDVPAQATFDLVIANIRPEVLLPLSSHLGERLCGDACVTLSGILDGEADAVLERYEAAGYELDPRAGGGRRTLESWTAFDLRSKR